MATEAGAGTSPIDDAGVTMRAGDGHRRCAATPAPRLADGHRAERQEGPDIRSCYPIMLRCSMIG
jgi:hypothetical protein